MRPRTFPAASARQLGSAYKHHGRILEFALRESLRENNRPKVWNNGMFKLSREDDALAKRKTWMHADKQLPYGNAVRTPQIDMVAFDNRDGSIRAYEIRRGNVLSMPARSDRSPVTSNASKSC